DVGEVDLAVVAVGQDRGEREQDNASGQNVGKAIRDSGKGIGGQGDAIGAFIEVFTSDDDGNRGKATYNDGVQNGSHAATNPSSAGRRFLVTPCANAAVPTPATLENSAR